MKNNILLNTFWGVLSLFFLNACEDSLMGSVYQTTSEQMLDEYMDEHLGEFLKIVGHASCLWGIYLSGSDG